MRVFYLAIASCLLGLATIGWELTCNLAQGQEPSVVEGKKPRPDKPDRHDRHHRHDDDFKPTPAPEPGPNPEPIPPRPRPQPDPNHIHVRPLPPHVGPVIPVPHVKPIRPHGLWWVLAGGSSLIKWGIVGLVFVALIVVAVFRKRFLPFN